MAFLESPRFPDAVSYGCQGGPTWQTAVIAVASGHEARNQIWSAARHRYDVSHVYHQNDGGKLALLRAFFLAVRGRMHGFRFRDPLDYAAASGEGLLTDLGGGEFQLVKRYTAGASVYDRDITKPVASAVAIAGGGTYSLDDTTGIVTHSAGAAPTGWAGEFDVPCRFETDVMAASLEAPGQFGHWQAISVIEIRP